MIVIIGFLVLVVAAVAAVTGVAANRGIAHPVGGNFVVFGQHLDGMSTGQLFLYGIMVGAVGMLGLSILLGAFTRRAASRGSRRELRGSRDESTALRLDRDRLTRQLDDEHAERSQTDGSVPPLEEPAVAESVPAGRSSIRERLGRHGER